MPKVEYTYYNRYNKAYKYAAQCLTVTLEYQRRYEQRWFLKKSSSFVEKKDKLGKEKNRCS